jgi:hypothetical protein
MPPRARELIEFVCPDRLPLRSLVTPLSPAAMSAKVLSGDVEAGDAALLVELPAQWKGQPRAPVDAGFEIVVLKGELTAGETSLPSESYLAVAAGAIAAPVACAAPTTVFLDVSPHATDDALVPASDVGWSAPAVPGPAPGLMHKLLRGDPLSGPCAFLLRVPAGWSESRTEWHECAEQCVILDGDLWHDRANGGVGGTMTKHCYFWRPPFVLHSPMGSISGGLMFMTTDGLLVNHYVEEEGLPPS